MKTIKISGLILLLFISINVKGNDLEKQEQPNIILFMVDQLIPFYTGIYGNEIVKTPNLDALAKEGIVFDNAYTTCPVCVPSRYSLLTGMYLASHGAFDNGAMLRSDIPTHNHYLNLAGYETTLSGKAHFVGPDQLHGFTRRLMTNVYPTEMKFMPQRTKESNFKDLHPKPIAIDYVGENTGPTQEDMLIEYDERAVFNAIRYLAEKRTNPGYSAQEDPPKPPKTPFFLQISLNNPHEPFFAYEEFWDMYKDVDVPIPEYPENMESNYTQMDKQLNALHGVERVNLKDEESLKQMHRAYYASVTYIDHKLGEVLKALERYGLRDNTIIVFLSDHGDMLGHRGMVQKRGFYEWSAHIPLMVSFPKNFQYGKSGTHCPDPVSITDVAPTILELAGIKNYLPMDGSSLLPQLNGNSNPDRYVFCENYSEGVQTICLMVRKNEYKYTYIHDSGNGKPETQLFNLKEEPSEWKNLSGDKKHNKIKNEYHDLIMNHFNPEELEKKAQISFERRKIINESRKKSNAPTWNYHPTIDVDNLYWR